MQDEVEVFEARARVGGRVFTAKLKNNDGNYSTIEMGGQNITDGGNAENFLRLAAELNLDIEEREISALSFLVYQDGKYSDFKKLLSAFSDSIQDIDDAVDCVCKESDSMQQVLDNLFKDHDLLKMTVKTRLVGYEGVSLEKQSVYHNVETLKAILKGGIAPVHLSEKIIFKQIKNGNAYLPLKIAEKLDNKIYTQKILRKVLLDNNQLRLEFRDGSHAVCEKLVLAIPAAVYGDIQFDPSLISVERLEQINNIAYGNNYKICYPVQNNISSDFRGVISDNFISFMNQDDQIMIVYCVEYVNDLSQPVKNIEAKVASLISTAPVLSELIDPQLVEYHQPLMHCWTSDRFAKGSYAGYGLILKASFDEMVSYKNISVKKIFSPIDERVFFLGEHTTILDAIGTMEAAVESAERMVEVI